MNTYKKLQPLSKVDAAYIAGLIDGEGTITLTRKHKTENRQLCISISSTEIELLEFVLTATGIGKITNKRPSKPHHAHNYAYAVYNRQALALLGTITQYLKSYKRERAALILKSYLEVTPRNGKYTRALLAEKMIFEQTVLSIKANS